MLREMLAADELYPTDDDRLARHRVSGPVLLHLQSQLLAGRNRRAHVEGISRADDELLQVPRPQI